MIYLAIWLIASIPISLLIGACIHYGMGSDQE